MTRIINGEYQNVKSTYCILQKKPILIDMIPSVHSLPVPQEIQDTTPKIKQTTTISPVMNILLSTPIMNDLHDHESNNVHVNDQLSIFNENQINETTSSFINVNIPQTSNSIISNGNSNNLQSDYF